MSSNGVGWQAIDNQFNDAVEGNSLCISAKPGSKIRRRTRILNRELKKFARLKSYSQYVKIKTNILRNVSEDESIEDEPRSVYSSDSGKSQCEECVPEIIAPSLSKTTRKKNNSTAQSHKNVENSLTSVGHKKARSSSHAKRNLTSLLGKRETESAVVNKTRPEEDANNDNGNMETSRVPAIGISAEGESTSVPTGDSGIDDDSQDNSPTCHQENNGFVEIDDIGENSDQTDVPPVIPASYSTTDNKRIEESQAIEEDEEENSQSEKTDERENDLSYVIPARNSTTDDERIEETQAIEEDEEEVLPDERTQKSQPMIKCTEIVKSKYTIIRDENEEEGDCSERNSQDHRIVQEIDESMDSDRMSPETERVAKLKRINLLCSGSESDSSEDDNGNISLPLLHDTAMSSQMISDSSDADDFSSSSTMYITDSDDPQTPKILDHHEGETNISKDSKNEQSTRKSIRDQIEQQDIFNSSQNFEEEKEEDEETDKAEKEEEQQKEVDEVSAHNRINDEVENSRNQSFEIDGESNGARTKSSTSLKYVLKNLSKRQLCDKEHFSRADHVEGRDTSGIVSHQEENVSRPLELKDFVASEGLMPTCELSTISIKDISTTLEDENNDEDVWLMEIPQSIMKDPNLCGKKMVMEKKNMRIGEDSYITTLRHDISFSCVLRSKMKKARYKTVNIRPVCSIKVRHLPVKKESLSIAETPRSPRSVPFPKNVKSRNPLMAESGSETPQSKKIRTNVEQDKIGQKKMKQRQKGIWNIDRFILKPKKKKNDIP